MSRIELQIVALGNFANVQSEIAKLNSQVTALNKNFSGIGINPTDISRIKQYTKEFDSALRSTGAFTAKQVQLQSETEKFGKSLEAGHLKLRQYFQIINQGAKQSQGSLRNLALEQTKLQNSIIVKDPLKGGLATVYTPNIINEAANAAKIATNQQRLYNMAIDRGATSLINWGKNTQWAGRQLTVGLTVPLTMFGNAASKVFQQMDQELTRMQKVYGTGLVQPSQAALATIRKDVSSLASELAKSWGTPIKDTAAMAADLAATGKTGLDLVNATREALRLATLGELDKQQAMQATVSLQNVYKLSTSELSDAVNFLNAVENQTSTSLQDLVDAIPRVGPVVAQMGGTFKDTAAMMVAMKEAGVPAAQSANAIKAALASIINPTKNAREAFKAYGIDVRSIATNNKGNAVGMLTDLQQKMKDLSPLVKEQLIEKMFGKFQMSRITALLDNLNKAGSQSRTVFQLMQASSQQLGAMADQELKIQTESTTGKYKRAVESLKADLLPIGEQFTKVITKIINFGDSVVKMLDKLGPMKNLLGFVLGFVAVAGPLIMLTGVFGNLFGYIMKGIGLFRTMRTEGAGLKGITGLLTAENIAASQATELMSQRMLEDVDATKLLASAIDQLNLKLESMVALMSRASNAGVSQAVAAAEAATLATGILPVAVKNPGRYRSSKPKKFSKGGKVPGSGDTDSVPALLTPGEIVIPKDKVRAYTNAITFLDPKTNQLLKTGMDRTALAEEYRSGGAKIQAPITRAVAQQMGGTNVKEEINIIRDNPEIKKFAHNISTKVAEEISKTTGKITDAELARINEKVMRAEAKKMGPAFQKATDTFLTQLTTFEDRTVSRIGSSGRVRQSDRYKMLQGVSSYKNMGYEGIANELGGSVKGLVKAHIAEPIIVSLNEMGPNLSNSAKKAVERQMLSIQEGAATGIATSTQSSSPSRIGKKAGKNMGDGLVAGVTDPKIIAEAKLAGQKIAMAEVAGIAAGAAAGAGIAAEETAAASAAAAGSKKKMGLKERLGGGMGLMAGSMAMSMLGDKIPGGSVVSGTLTGASLGMMVGPEGAAVGAVAGLAISGISALMKKEKEHQAMAEATFKSSTSALSMFGAAAQDTSSHVWNIKNNVDKLKTTIPGFHKQLNDFTDMVAKLPTDDPLSLILKNIKSTSDSGAAKNIAEAFVNTQTAINGLDSSKAKDLLNLIFASTGHSDLIGGGYTADNRAEAISKMIVDLNKKTLTQAQLVSAASPGAGKAGSLGMANLVGTGQEKAVTANKELVKTYKDLINLAGNTKKYEEFKAIQDGITYANISQSQSFQLLQTALPEAKKKLEEYEKAGLNAGQAIAMLQAENLGLTASFRAESLFGSNAVGFPGMGSKALKEFSAKNAQELVKEYYERIAKEAAKQGGGGGAGDTTLSTLDKLIAELEKSKQALQDQKDALDKSIQKQKDYNDQLQKTQDYLTSTTDLENQIRMARAKGDYLQVGLLKQQLAAKQTAFNAGVTISPAEQRSQDLADRIAELTKQIQEANAQNKVIKKEIKAANKASGGYIPAYARGSFGGVFGPGTSTSDSIPAYLSNGEYVLSANAVRNIPGNIRTLDKINGGDISSFNSSAVNNYSISVNVAGTNANPDQIAQAVLNTIQRRSNMNHTTRIA